MSSASSLLLYFYICLHFLSCVFSTSAVAAAASLFFFYAPEKMVLGGLESVSLTPSVPPQPMPIPCANSRSRSRTLFLFPKALPFHSFHLNFSSKTNNNSARFILFAQNKGNNKSDNQIQESEEAGGGGGGGGGEERNGMDDEKSRKDRQWSMSDIKLGDLLLDPNPDNILSVGLTGLLAWASVQVLGQLFFVSLAILLAALKYSFIAALLLFILITLL